MLDSADRLRILRAKLKLSRSDVAAVIYRSERAVADIENGRRPLDVDDAIRLSRAYNVSPYLLLGPAPRRKERSS